MTIIQTLLYLVRKEERFKRERGGDTCRCTYEIVNGTDRRDVEMHGIRLMSEELVYGSKDQ